MGNRGPTIKGLWNFPSLIQTCKWMVGVLSSVWKRSLQVRVVFNIYHFHVGGRVLEILHKNCPLRYFTRGEPFLCFCMSVFF